MHYFDRPGLSFHALKDLGTKSPFYFYKRHVTKEIPGFSSASMNFGTAVHAATLEPQTYREQVTVCPAEHLTPSGELSSKAATREWRKLLPPYACIIGPYDYALAIHMARRVRENPLAAAILDGSTCEQGVATNVLGTPSKAKIDIIARDGSVWDLKTIKSLDAVAQQVRDFGYIEQIDWYGSINGTRAGGLIFIESEEPHRVLVASPDAGALLKARARWAVWLATYQVCQSTGDWPNDPTEKLIITSDDIG